MADGLAPQGVVEATAAYEAWLGGQLRLVPDDLQKKHRRMAKGPFQFLRATYYRWVQYWQNAGAELRDAPEVLSVADLHFENFGTWRDADGRLAWGVNDFDEAFPLPWTQDRSGRGPPVARADRHRQAPACDSVLAAFAGARSRAAELCGACDQAVPA